MNVDFSAEELRSLYCFLSELKGIYKEVIKQDRRSGLSMLVARAEKAEKRLKVLDLHMRRIDLEEAIARLDEESRFKWKRKRADEH